MNKKTEDDGMDLSTSLDAALEAARSSKHAIVRELVVPQLLAIYSTMGGLLRVLKEAEENSAMATTRGLQDDN